jgi:hypothetical protein
MNIEFIPLIMKRSQTLSEAYIPVRTERAYTFCEIVGEKAYEPLKREHRRVEVKLHEVIVQPAVVLLDQFFEDLLIY